MLRSLGLTDDTIRGVIALLLVVAILVYPAFGVQVAPELWALAGGYLGFYTARRLNGDRATFRHTPTAPEKRDGVADRQEEPRG